MLSEKFVFITTFLRIVALRSLRKYLVNDKIGRFYRKGREEEQRSQRELRIINRDFLPSVAANLRHAESAEVTKESMFYCFRAKGI